MGKVTISRMNSIDEEKWVFEVEDYTKLREFLTSREFLSVTTINPNQITCWVKGMDETAEDDLLLVSGDTIEFEAPSEKGLISNKEIIKRLKKLVGLQFIRHGGNHDVWQTAKGKKIPFPRHARDMSVGTLRSILRQADLEMGLDEFVSTKH